MPECRHDLIFASCRQPRAGVGNGEEELHEKQSAADPFLLRFAARLEALRADERHERDETHV